jgi:hypothetical protein
VLESLRNLAGDPLDRTDAPIIEAATHEIDAGPQKAIRR